MVEYLDKLEQNRSLLLERTKGLTEQQYNIVPPGFSNNIIWNMGHILVVSENLLYKGSPYQRPVHEFTNTEFQRGSKPEGIINSDEILVIRHALMQTVDFYKKCTGLDTPPLLSHPFGNVMERIDEGKMQFLLFHEDMHYRRIARLLKEIEN